MQYSSANDHLSKFRWLRSAKPCTLVARRAAPQPSVQWSFLSDLKAKFELMQQSSPFNANPLRWKSIEL